MNQSIKKELEQIFITDKKYIAYENCKKVLLKYNLNSTEYQNYIKWISYNLKI